MYIDPIRKILRYPARIYSIREGYLTYPINVELDLSDRCNLKCTHCAFVHIRRDCDMSIGIVENIVSQLVCSGIQAVTLTGGGEPTMNPDFEKIVFAISQHHISIGMYTNGIKFYPDAFNKMEWVYISLDAWNKRDFQRIKGVDCFGKVVHTIAKFAEIKRETTLGLGFLLNGLNFQNVQQMAELGQDLQVDYVQFRPVVGLESYEWIEDALECLSLVDALVPVYYPIQRFTDLRDKPPRGYEICRASVFVPCVGADGTLWVCPNTRGLRSLGSLVTNSFQNLWQRRSTQHIGKDCREMCRNHRLNQTLEYVCSRGPHDNFV